MLYASITSDFSTQMVTVVSPHNYATVTAKIVTVITRLGRTKSSDF